MPLVYGKVKDTEIVVPLQVDANGVISVAAAKGDLNNQNHGYIGGAWQKNPIPFGFSAQILDSVSDGTLAVGTNDLDFSTVPAGEIWVITAGSWQYGGTVAGVVGYFYLMGTTIIPLTSHIPAVSWETKDYTVNWILKEGDKLRLKITGATLNDTGAGWVAGYKMDIDL